MFIGITIYIIFYYRKKLVLKGSLKSTVRNLTITLNGKVILGACDDGLYAWNIDFVGSNQDHVRFDFILKYLNFIGNS